MSFAAPDPLADEEVSLKVLLRAQGQPTGWGQVRVCTGCLARLSPPPFPLSFPSPQFWLIPFSKKRGGNSFLPLNRPKAHLTNSQHPLPCLAPSLASDHSFSPQQTSTTLLVGVCQKARSPMMPSSALLPCLMAATVLLGGLQAQGPGIRSNRPTVAAVRSDIPYIQCAVCETLAKNTYRQVKALRDGLKPGKKLTELAILELLEKVANPLKDEGEWIAKLDLVESGSKLLLEEQLEVGKCGTECKTIQRVAEELVADHDTDMAERLYKTGTTRASFTNWLCREASAACKKIAPPLPKDRKPGPPFTVQDKQEADLEKMMANMKEMGMGGQLYDRESAAQMAGMGGAPGGGEDEDEDDDEEEKAGGATGDLLGKAMDAGKGVLGSAKAGISTAFESAKSVLGGSSKAAEAEEAVGSVTEKLETDKGSSEL